MTARLCLNMIVKNEVAIIERLLRSVVPYIDSYAICDTGSTDGTPERIQGFFDVHGVPGSIKTIEFRDFGQARNAALEYARDCLAMNLSSEERGACYLLLADADMELVVDDPAFRDRLVAHAYHVSQISGITYDNTRLVRASVPAVYQGVTHEYLDTGPMPERFVGIHFLDHEEGSNRSDKYKRDARLLRGALDVNPKDARSMFYLAETLRYAAGTDGFDRVESLKESIQWYERRISLGGWDEEVWYAMHQSACCTRDLGDEIGFTHKALRAFEVRPWRAEPLHALAKYYRERGKTQIALAFAKIGESIPYPKDDRLFVEHYVYHHAFRYEESIAGFYSPNPLDRLKAKALTFELTVDRTAPCWVKDSVRRNSVHYAAQAAVTFPGSVDLGSIPVTVDEHYMAMNPSICDVEGELYCVVRTVNYTIDDAGRYVMHDNDQGIIRTRNLLAKIDLDGGKIVVREQLPIVDSGRSAEGRTSFVVQGYEDLRLFHRNGELWASATVRDRHPDGLAEIALLKLKVLEGSAWVDELHVLRDVMEKGRHEKNWMPLSQCRHETDLFDCEFVYSCDPLKGVHFFGVPASSSQAEPTQRPSEASPPDKWRCSQCGGLGPSTAAIRHDRSCESYGRWYSETPRPNEAPPPKEREGNSYDWATSNFEGSRWPSSSDLGHLRGGSQVIPFSVGILEGWLACVHEAHDFGKRRYLHRFIWLQEMGESRLTVAGVTDPFYLTHPGIEFVAGMILQKDQLILSYGVEDREARLMTIPASAVRSRLRFSNLSIASSTSPPP